MLEDLDPLVLNMKDIHGDDVLDLVGISDVDGRIFLICIRFYLDLVIILITYAFL